MIKKNIFIFDQNKCVACHACIVACMNENGYQFPNQWRNVLQSQTIHHPGLPLFYLSMACNHCDDAPCLVNCPAKAYYRDEITGAVLHDERKCIGCKYCTWACPFDAPKFILEKGVIEKCTFCNHRIEEDQKPACAEHCPVGALDFQNVEFSRKESKDSSPVNIDAGSNIKVIQLRNRKGPEQDLHLFKKLQPEENEPKRSQKITALKEWPLLVFTLLSVVLVSVYTSGISENFNHIQKLVFMISAAVSVAFSMFHLGKKTRSWRSLINIRNSWLSREILFMILFYVTVLLDFYIFNISAYYGTALGLFFLYSIDMLYGIAQYKRKIKIHSAQTLLILFTITLLLKELLLLLMFIIAFRAFLYMYRKYYAQKKMILVSILRIFCFLSPILLFFVQTDIFLILAIVFAGEIMDRIEFYNELNVPDPAFELTLY